MAMAPDLHPHWYDTQQHHETDCSTTVLCVRFLLVALFALLVFALGYAMVRNHFFSGGALNNHQGHLVGPQ